jgi:hypothetical protein
MLAPFSSRLRSSGTFAIAFSSANIGNRLFMPRDQMSFCVTEDKSTLQIGPSRRRVVLTVAMLLYGGVAVVVGGIYMDFWFRHDPLAWWSRTWFFTIAECLTPVLLWGCGIWTWCIRDRQLSIDLNTREVTFGNRQLCGPRTVRSVKRRYDYNPDAIAPYSIHFKLIDGTSVDGPSPLFGRIRSYDEARNLAELLAARLNVQVCGDV